MVTGGTRSAARVRDVNREVLITVGGVAGALKRNCAVLTMKYVNSVHPRDSGLMAWRIVIYGRAKDKYSRIRKSTMQVKWSRYVQRGYFSHPLSLISRCENELLNGKFFHQVLYNEAYNGAYHREM